MHIRHFGAKQGCVCSGCRLKEPNRPHLSKADNLPQNKYACIIAYIDHHYPNFSQAWNAPRMVTCGRRNKQFSTHALQTESALLVHKYRWQYTASAWETEVDSLCARLSARLVKIIVRKLQSYFLRNVAITPDEVYYDLPRPLAETA